MCISNIFRKDFNTVEEYIDTQFPALKPFFETDNNHRFFDMIKTGASNLIENGGRVSFYRPSDFKDELDDDIEYIASQSEDVISDTIEFLSEYCGNYISNMGIHVREEEKEDFDETIQSLFAIERGKRGE